MHTLTVALGERSYPIVIGAGLLSSHEPLAQQARGHDVVLVSNTVVAPLYAELVKQCLPGQRIVEVVLPDGEQHKTLSTASRVFDVMIANRIARDALVLALGGGVIGDLAGFVAACYQRGIGLIQIPTTLLAHVDSSVGGKTAVNHPGGKNLIGAFHQPRAVIADTELLRTLPDRELRSGLAEVIKYGLICDPAFFDWIEANIDALLARSPPALGFAIYRSCQIKAQIVARDEREQGERALLNLGHTFGHAIESATGYSGWHHGEAVGTGMLMAAEMSQRSGTLEPSVVTRLRTLLQQAGLPVEAPRIGAQRALDYMRVDKKVQSGRVRLVLLSGLGKAMVTSDYPDAALRDTLAAHFG
ncbi:MAG TPA: 3-dehydroquinate synthase [Steroidobacteraceae bacterium]